MNVLSRGPTALHRGCWERVFRSNDADSSGSFGMDLRVVFTRPDGSEVSVDGFADGNGRFGARAYCDRTGLWRWRSKSPRSELDGESGGFEVLPSNLPGKLRIHSGDPRQFAWDNGEWFLHIGDTGYRCLIDTEPEWRTYIDQAVEMGATKIRAWFCRDRGTVSAFFSPDRRRLNLPFWREIDRRLRYALTRYPRLQFQLILYGEDTEELRRYGRGDPASRILARTAQARWSAFPNVSWCISNDRTIVDSDEGLEAECVPAAVIDRIGGEMAEREPWGTLLTNHQARWTGYAFCASPWSDIVTVEDLDQVDGRLILDYRSRCSAPVVLDEDRYEHHRPPKHPRYFFRRLMWSSLFSGGHATYGGLRTYEPYDELLAGVQGYRDACAAGKLRDGAGDFPRIHEFFRRTGISLDGWIPEDSRGGNDPMRIKCCTRGNALLVYLANPDGDDPGTDDASGRATTCRLRIARGEQTARWFDPRTGDFSRTTDVAGPVAELTTPEPADWVVLIQPRTRG